MLPIPITNVCCVLLLFLITVFGAPSNEPNRPIVHCRDVPERYWGFVQSTASSLLITRASFFAFSSHARSLLRRTPSWWFFKVTGLTCVLFSNVSLQLWETLPHRMLFAILIFNSAAEIPLSFLESIPRLFQCLFCSAFYNNISISVSSSCVRYSSRLNSCLKKSRVRSYFFACVSPV